MSVRMIAPEGTKPEVCSRMLLKRKDWVRTQRQYFSQFHPLTKPREYVSGETHLFLGRRLRLKVAKGSAKGVKATRQHLTVCAGHATTARLVEATLWQWYRERATDLFQERLLGCMVKLNIPKNEGPKSLILRRYKSRWGSMSAGGVLGLNLDLIRAPIECIDYVIIHELCHLRFPHHGPRFWDLLERVMPDWRKRKTKLERLTA
jgi:predicted metal-dependent hydrolase